MAISNNIFFKTPFNLFKNTVMQTKTRLNAAMLIKGIKRTLRRVPVIKSIMAIIKKEEVSPKTSDYDLAIYHSRSDLLNKHGFEIKNKTIMDIGCGNNCLHAFEFLSSGAKEVILCEILADNCLTAEIIKSRIPHRDKEYFDRFSANLKIIDDSIENIKSLPDSSVDIIISTALLEHVCDLDKAFSEMRRILKKDGCMVHSIDLRDHFFFNYPLHFLRYSPWWWKNFYTKPETFTNRHRMPYYFQLIKKYGFEVIYKNAESTDQETGRFGIHKDLRGYCEEDNRVTHLDFMAVRT